MNIYLKIKTDYISILGIFLFVSLIIDTQYFYLIQFNSSSLHNTRAYIGIFGLLFMLFLNLKEDYKNRIHDYRVIEFFILYVLVVILLEALYSMYTYRENVNDMVWGLTGFNYIFFLPLFIYLFDVYGSKKFMKTIVILGSISVMLALFLAICNDAGLPIILPGAYFMGIRDGHTRIAITNIGRIAIIYLFSKLMDMKIGIIKILLGLLLVFMLIAFIYYQATRSANIAIMVAFFVMFALYRGNNNKKILYTLVILIVICILFTSSSMLFDSFSVEGEKGSSTLARLEGIHYFYEIFRKNPFWGLGIIRPKTDQLLQIWSGPKGIYYLDDIGLLGGLFETGILGIFLYLVPLIRMLFLSYKLYQNKAEIALFSIGMTVYIIATQTSLSMLSVSRVLGTIFFWAYLESSWNEHNKDKLVVASGK